MLLIKKTKLDLNSDNRRLPQTLKISRNKILSIKVAEAILWAITKACVLKDIVTCTDLKYLQTTCIIPAGYVTIIAENYISKMLYFL